MAAGRGALRAWARFAGLTTLGGLLLLGGLGAWGYHAFAPDLPAAVSRVTDYRPLRASRIFSATGELIGTFFVEDRVLLPPAEQPELVKQAFVAAEGRTAITRQVAHLLIADPVVPPEAARAQALLRWVHEGLVALRLHRRVARDQILGIYLNHVYLGYGAYGVAAGASAYFGKAPADLTLAETAMLAALPRSPRRLTPFQDFPRAQARQRQVLQAMVDQHLLGAAQAEAARQAPLALAWNRPALTSPVAPHFVETVRRYVAERYGDDPALAGGLRIHTTLDMRQQRAAEAALQRRLAGAADLEGALVALDPTTGHLLAMVGGKQPALDPFNRATQARRKIGSAIDAFLYAAAIEQGMTPVTMVGATTLRAALARGLGATSERLGAKLGADTVAGELRAMGITSRLPLAPSLGTADLGLTEVAYALAALPAGGKRVDPISILRISDAEGRPLEDHTKPPPGTPRLSPETAYIVTDMMRAVIESGTGQKAQALGRPAAGETGTSADHRDAWFFGFTPELLCGVWVGRDDGKAMGPDATGGRLAVPIWLEFMQAALGDAPVREFAIPPGIVLARANPETGAPAPPSQFKSRLIPFKRGTLPPAFTAGGARFTDEEF